MKQKRFHLAVTFLLTAFVGACSQPVANAAQPLAVGSTITEQAPILTATPHTDCDSDLPPAFADYASWTQVNPDPIRGHESWVDIYVNDIAKKTYLSASGEVFPVCSKIVKTHLEGPESQSITAVTIMVKMQPGYDPAHNDWWWGMYDKTGQNAEMSGIVQVCIACHQPAEDQDYVFSQAVLSEIQN